MSRHGSSDMESVLPRAVLSKKMMSTLLKINEDMYNNLPEFFITAKKIQERLRHHGSNNMPENIDVTDRVTQAQLKIMLDKVNSYIFHCSVLCTPLSAMHSEKINVNELKEILKILEDIQLIFLQAINFDKSLTF